MQAKRVVLAEYFCTDDTTLLFIVRSDFKEPYVNEIKMPLGDIRQYARANFGVERGGARVRSLDIEDWQSRFASFIEPISAWAEEGDIIWLVPHDALHYLPLHALKIEGRYLIERNPVCYSPSASVMQYCHAKRKGRRQNALIMADSRSDLPLLHAREQAVAVQRLFAPHGELYLGDAATKSLLTRRLVESKDDIDIIHLACHGYYDPIRALNSGIMLATAEGEAIDETVTSETRRTRARASDLTAEDIFNLSMRADLVTLSACESGVNDRKPGDELIGLTRALIYAGTPSVVVSLWSVDEISTSILMQQFYRALKDGASKADALQQAQLGLMRITAQQVIDYCADAKQRLADDLDERTRWIFDYDIANLRLAAYDYDHALLDYAKLSLRLVPDSDAYRRVAIAETRCRLAMRAPQPVDYARVVYAHPFYWAPFTLVGDWK